MCMWARMCVCLSVGEHTRQLHFTVESSGSNILAEWTSNLLNDLRAVKDTAVNSNCKKNILASEEEWHLEGYALKWCCGGWGGSKIEGCSSQSGIITSRAQVQSWRCEEKIKVSCSSDLQQILRGNEAARGPRPCPGSRLWSHDFRATFFLQLSKLKHCAKWKKMSSSPPKISSPES